MATDNDKYDPNDGTNCLEHWYVVEVRTRANISPQTVHFINLIYCEGNNSLIESSKSHTFGICNLQFLKKSASFEIKIVFSSTVKFDRSVVVRNMVGPLFKYS